MNELPYIMNTEKKSMTETNEFAPVLPKKTRKRFALLDSKVCEVADTNTEQHDIIKDHRKKSLNAKLVSCDERLLETRRYSDESSKMYTRHQETLSERCLSDSKCEKIVSYFDDLLNELSIREEQGKAKKFHEFENLLSICFDDNNSCASFLQIYNYASLDKISLPNSDQNNCFKSGILCDISGNVKNVKFEIDAQNVENFSSLEDCKHIYNENDRKIENAIKYDLRECSSKDLHNGRKVKNQSVIVKDISIINELRPEGKKENKNLQENLIVPINTDHLWITSKLWSDSKISHKANNSFIDKTNHNSALTSLESSEVSEFQSILIPETTVPVFEKHDGCFKNANNIPNSGIVPVVQKCFIRHSILEENQVVEELNETEKINGFDKNLPELLKTPILPKYPDICVSQNSKCFIQSQKQQKLLKPQACGKETNVFSGCTDVMKDDRNNSSFQNYVSDFKVSNSPRSYSSSQACKSVIPCSEFGKPASGCYKVNLHVEGKNVHLGPIPFEVFPRMTLRLLKIKVEQELGIKTSKQMWILCNAIANNNDISLWDYGVKSGSHMFLYVDSELETFDIKIRTEYNNASTSFDKNITSLTSNVGKGKTNFKKLLLKCKENIKKEHQSKIANLKINETSVLPNSKETVGVLECSYFINMNPYNSFENTNDPLKNCSEITPKNNEDLANTSLNSKDTDENSRTITSGTVEEFDYIRIGCKESLSAEKCKSSHEENHETRCSSASRESEDDKPLYHSEIEHETCEKEEQRHKESLKEIEANYNIQLETESLDLVENAEDFICPVCFGNISKGNGIVLHDCLHSFCRECLSSVIKFAEGTTITCPYSDESYSCHINLQQREIKALVDAESYEKHLQRSIITAESLAERSFHCKTPDCTGWCVIEDSVYVFCCPACHHYNCLNCQAIHEGLNCRQYQNSLKQRQEIDHESEKTLVFLNNMMTDGKAMKCPKCDLILMKKWGCDWLKCSICKTEICWITKGPRWGPKGQGDTSAGCKCGVNGVKCHPSCTYCH